MNRLLHSTIHQVIWYFCGFILNPYSLLCSIFFFSRKLCFLWSSCLLFTTELISLDTSGTPTVGFFLKVTSHSWMILSIRLEEFNSIDWLLKRWWWIFLKKMLFYCCKSTLIWEKILEVFWRIYLNIMFWILLKYFPRKLLGDEIFWSMVSWDVNFFLKNL